MRTTRIAVALGIAATLVLGACSSGGTPPSNTSQSKSPTTSAATTAPQTSAGTAGTSANPTSESSPGSATVTPDPPANENIRLEDPDTGATPETGGTVRLLARLDISELDPHRSTDTTGVIMGALVYEGLVENFRGEIVPAIAESWEISPDGLTYTFKLRDDAYFHSGRKVEAADVQYSLARVMNPDTRSPNINSYASIDKVEAPDPATVVVSLKKPHTPMLFLFAALSSVVVDKDVVEASGGNLGAKDGGSGPFSLAEHNVGRNVLLKAHDKYWHPELPYVDAIDITFNPDDNARAAAIRSNSVDVLFRPAAEFIDSLKADENLKWYGGSGSLSLHLLLNVSKAPFDNVKVRQAIFHALDRQEILNVANSGAGVPLNAGYLPPDRWGGIDEPIYGAPDLEKAKALLTEAGYPDGFDAELMVIGSSAFQVRQAEVEQAQLAKIGINISIRTIDAALSSQELRDNNFEMYQSGFGLRADPDERFSAAFTTGGGLNYSKWSDPEFDSLIEQARTELDMAKREKLYQDADRILAERGPVAFTYLSADFDVVWKNVMGYKADPTPGFGVYKYIWLDQ